MTKLIWRTQIETLRNFHHECRWEYKYLKLGNETANSNGRSTGLVCIILFYNVFSFNLFHKWFGVLTIGLEYLYYGCKPPIIHRDVKTTNILLNEYLHAKLVDFGLSKISPTDGNTHVSTLNVSGTPRYVDPKWVLTSI